MHNTRLKISIKELKEQHTAGTSVTHKLDSNNISITVSDIPEYFSNDRKIPAINIYDDGDSASVIYKVYGSIKTGYITNWSSLSKEDRENLYAQRTRLGIRVGKGGIPNPKSGSYNTGSKSVGANSLAQLSEQNNKYKRHIKYLKLVKPNNNEHSDGSNADTDTGYQFGEKIII